MELEINIKQKIYSDHFEDIIVTALEGGSNYWYSLDVDEFKKDLAGKDGEPLSSRIAKSLENPDFKMNVYDAEALEEEFLGILSQSSMLKAIELAYDEYQWVYSDLMHGDLDATSADILFQLAVMGELVFG